MYSEFKAQSTQTFAVRKKPNDQHTFSNPSLAADGFKIWWQKTIAQTSQWSQKRRTSCVRTV